MRRRIQPQIAGTLRGRSMTCPQTAERGSRSDRPALYFLRHAWDRHKVAGRPDGVQPTPLGPWPTTSRPGESFWSAGASKLGHRDESRSDDQRTGHRRVGHRMREPEISWGTERDSHLGAYGPPQTSGDPSRGRLTVPEDEESLGLLHFFPGPDEPDVGSVACCGYRKRYPPSADVLHGPRCVVCQDLSRAL